MPSVLLVQAQLEAREGVCVQRLQQPGQLCWDILNDDAFAAGSSQEIWTYVYSCCV